MTNQAPFIKPTLFEFSHLAHDPWSMNLEIGAPNGIRTRVAALKGRQTTRCFIVFFQIYPPTGTLHIVFIFVSKSNATCRYINPDFGKLPSAISPSQSAPSSSSRIGNRFHPKSFSPIWISIWLTCLDLAARHSRCPKSSEPNSS